MNAFMAFVFINAFINAASSGARYVLLKAKMTAREISDEYLEWCCKKANWRFLCVGKGHGVCGRVCGYQHKHAQT